MQINSPLSPDKNQQPPTAENKSRYPATTRRWVSVGPASKNAGPTLAQRIRVNT